MASNTFSSFGLDGRLLKAIKIMRFNSPFPIQTQAIPLVLEGKDCVICSRTGSGKTLAFAIPMIQKILKLKMDPSIPPANRGLVLVPTMELCAQTKSVFDKLLEMSFNVLKVANVADNNAISILSEKPDIIIGTPLVVKKWIENGKLDFKNDLELFVVDEADILLSIGSFEDLNKITSYLPNYVQGVLLSATMTENLESLKKLMLHNPVIIDIKEENNIKSNLLEYYINTEEKEKFLSLYVIIRLNIVPQLVDFSNSTRIPKKGKIIIFVNDIDKCYKIKLFLERFSIKSAILNAELPLNTRYHTIQQFNQGTFDILIATDISEEKPISSEMEDEEKEKENESKENKEKSSENKKKKRKVEENKEGEELNKEDIKLIPKKETKNAKKSKKAKSIEDLGAGRGIDFRGVLGIINFDIPTRPTEYVHRVGRSGRAAGRGMALSFVSASEQEEFNSIVEIRKSKTIHIAHYQIKANVLDSLRYRCEDMLRSVTGFAVKQARLTEIKKEILNSEKLQEHFQVKPKESSALQVTHTNYLDQKGVLSHLKHLPKYLLGEVSSVAEVVQAAEEETQQLPTRKTVERTRSFIPHKRKRQGPIYKNKKPGKKSHKK